MNDKIETGGPAFPDGSINQWGNADNGGMTLRDYFAAKAMQGDFISGIGQDDFADCASRAYAMADAMLKARQE